MAIRKSAAKKAAAPPKPAPRKKPAPKPEPVEELIPAHVNRPTPPSPAVVGGVTLPDFSTEPVLPEMGFGYDDQLVTITDRAGVKHEVSKVHTSRAERAALAEQG
jgi:LmbE family N-acetylglucosaminyl deacetylase